MKKLLVMAALATSAFIYSCGGGGGNEAASTQSSDATTKDATAPQSSDATAENPPYDPERGKGKFTHVEIADEINPTMVTAGERVYKVKCASCHKLTDEKLVGPGWKGVSQRHKPEWIMNFVTNTDEMIDKDPKVQQQLEICMVRMPNQNLSDEAARGIYEFMRKNDKGK
jgi:cytochrome c2